MLYKLSFILTRCHTPFLTADTLTVDTNRNVTALRRPAKQLRHIVYLGKLSIYMNINDLHVL